jgi:hypothetical protein
VPSLGLAIAILLVLDSSLALLLAGRGLLLGRCASILSTLSLALARSSLGRCGSGFTLSRSNNRSAGFDVLDVVLELVLELLDDLAAGVDVAAAGDGSLLSQYKLGLQVGGGGGKY